MIPEDIRELRKRLGRIWAAFRSFSAIFNQRSCGCIIFWGTWNYTSNWSGSSYHWNPYELREKFRYL